MNPALPERLQLQFLGLIGERVRPWLDALPTLVRRLCKDWDVELHGTFEDGWSSYVAFGTRQDNPVVLKIAPKHTEGRAEIAGLLARDGGGVPQLLCHDLEAAALLLARVDPGTPLQTGEIDVRGIAALLRRLHVPVKTPPPHITLLGEQLAIHWPQRAAINHQLLTPLSGELVAGAAETAQRLSHSWSRPVLLHGDFEARNILHVTDGLVAIDSPAVVGDPGYDAAWWVLSESDHSAESLPVRVTQLAAALNYPDHRIWTWAWPLAVDDLLDKLHEPGWSHECIHDALAAARSIASIAARPGTTHSADPAAARLPEPARPPKPGRCLAGHQQPTFFFDGHPPTFFGGS